MPNEVLLSNVGGVLSLWLGVTVMTVIEVIELIYFIGKNWFDKRHQQASAPSGAEQLNQVAPNREPDPERGQNLTKVSVP